MVQAANGLGPETSTGPEAATARPENAKSASAAAPDAIQRKRCMVLLSLGCTRGVGISSARFLNVHRNGVSGDETQGLRPVEPEEKRAAAHVEHPAISSRDTAADGRVEASTAALVLDGDTALAVKELAGRSIERGVEADGRRDDRVRIGHHNLRKRLCAHVR